MKDVGYTQEGNRLVEMSRTEYAQFAALSMAVEGRRMPIPFDVREMVFIEGYDFEKVFEVIRAFYDAHFRINDLQNFLENVKDSLNRV